MIDQSLSDQINAIFGQKLAMARRARSITQRELSQSIGVSRVTVANIEGGRQNVQLAQVYAIARSLNIPPHELLPTPSELEHLTEGAQTSDQIFVNLAKLRLRALLLEHRNEESSGD